MNKKNILVWLFMKHVLFNKIETKNYQTVFQNFPKFCMCFVVHDLSSTFVQSWKIKWELNFWQSDIYKELNI